MKKTCEQIYRSYVQAYRDILKKPRRTVKNFDKFFKKFPFMEQVVYLCGMFNTFWSSIDPYKFFCIGFKQFGDAFSLKVAVKKSHLILESYKKVEILREQKSKNIEETILNSLKFLTVRLKKIKIEKYFIKYCLKDIIEHKINILIFIILIEMNMTAFQELNTRGFVPDLNELYLNVKESNEYKRIPLDLRCKVMKAMKMILDVK